MRPANLSARNRRGRLAALLVLPMLLWSAVPALAGGAAPCPAPMILEAAAHLCCPESAAGAPNHRAAEMRALGAHESVAPVADSGADPCACLPADNGPLSADGVPAATTEAPSFRSPQAAGAVGVLPAKPEPSSAKRVLRCPDESRRVAAGPPLFLLHDQLLI